VRIQRQLRDGEFEVIVVTPISIGVLGPLLAVVLSIGALWAAAATWQWVDRNVAWISALVVFPPAVVLGGRVWRWRSRKIVVTSQRVIHLSGIARRRWTSIELIDIVTSQIDQRWHERLSRRGVIHIETPVGTFVTDRIRRPDAFSRIIDHQRQQLNRYAEAHLDHAGELSAALEAGLLSSEEYDERWRHLFGPDTPRASG
jgi:hypothetical protein